MLRPALAAAPRPLQRPDAVLDPSTQALLERVAEAARQEGHADGVRAGIAHAAREHAGRQLAVDAALDRAVAELRALRGSQGAQVAELALAVAETVLGCEPSDGAKALLGRVRVALAELDDTPLVLSACPAEVDALAAGLAARPDVRVEADPALQPGDARIVGQWSRADLLRSTALAAIAEALDA